MAVIKNAKRDRKQKVKELAKKQGLKEAQKLGQKEAKKGRKLGHTRSVQKREKGMVKKVLTGQ